VNAEGIRLSTNLFSVLFGRAHGGRVCHSQQGSQSESIRMAGDVLIFDRAAAHRATLLQMKHCLYSFRRLPTAEIVNNLTLFGKGS
jgi:hypothetical protein